MAAEEEPNSISETTTASQISNLLSRVEVLLAEIELYQQRLTKYRPEGIFLISKFREDVSTERGVLARSSSSPSAEVRHNIARGSNLPFFESVWSTAKSSKDLVALRWKRKSTGIDLVNRIERLVLDEFKEAGPAKVLVDVICDGGRTWKKVSLVTNRRLLFDLAKEGWMSDESDGEDWDDPNSGDRDIPLLKMAKELVAAARQTRVLTKHPTVHLILPRLERGQTAAVDGVLDTIKSYGATVICKDECQTAPTIEDALPRMIPDPLSSLSSTLNLDCTILLALVSDLSHSQVCPRAWFHDHLKRQLEREADDRLLPSTLYPILISRDLVCTKQAATRMREIVNTIGTPTEKARSAALLGDDITLSQQQLLEELQQTSIYPVSSDLRLPVTVVDWKDSKSQARLPTAISKIGKKLSPINEAVFMHGWAAGQTTVTSNRSAVKQIESELEKLQDIDDEDLFPSIWVCPVARSLVGKEKRGQPKLHASDQSHDSVSQDQSI